MLVTEIDHDLLQTYLDGELPAGECERLWRRLAVEPALAGELDQLRADRDGRRAAWASLEPSELTAARVERDIVAAGRRQQRLAAFWRLGQVASSAAACLLLGLWVGVVEHDKLAPTRGGVPANAGLVAPNAALASASFGNGGGTAAPPQSADRSNAPTAVASANKVRVFLKDAAGNVTAEHDFDTMDDAQRFADEFARTQQQRRESIRDNLVVPVSSEQ